MPRSNASIAENHSRRRTFVAVPVASCALLVMLGILIVASMGCASKAVRGVVDPAACAVFDSLYQASGFESPLAIGGKATIDANQNRIRGKIHVDVESPDQIVFEFTSSILFGSKREDFVFSLVQDTLRIIDRERGAYYEGEEAEEVLRESLEADFPVASVLTLALGGHPDCDQLDELNYKLGSDGKVVFSGKQSGRPFRVAFAAGNRKLEEISWPVFSRDGGSDQLEVEYRWETAAEGGGLREVVMSLESKQWRCKIRSSEAG